MTRDLLMLGVAWKIQEQAYGGLGAATRRRVADLAKTLERDGDITRSRVARVRPGAKLVREWRGETHTVIVRRRWFRMEGPALAIAVGDRARDHRRSLVRPALLRVEGKDADQHCKMPSRRPAMRRPKNSRTVSRKASIRCAIYTRKSSEEGLEQDFNSLDAQREACEAYHPQPEARRLGCVCPRCTTMAASPAAPWSGRR